jgi:hypothetical protein
MHVPIMLLQSCLLWLNMARKSQLQPLLKQKSFLSVPTPASPPCHRGQWIHPAANRGPWHGTVTVTMAGQQVFFFIACVISCL